MIDAVSDFDEDDEAMDDDEDLEEYADDDLTAFDRTRADYSGVEVDDEFQPVDDVELDEEGMLLDDPERLAILPDGADDPDGSAASPQPSLDPDDVGWDDETR
jgi:hypothetical protein